MARPAKQTVDYFPHRCQPGKTLFILEARYGDKGYAFWFKVLSLLGITEGHAYHFGNDQDRQYLEAFTRTDTKQATEIIDLLAELGAIDKELWQSNKVIWSDNFIEGIKDAYRNRKVEVPLKPVSSVRNPVSDVNNAVSDVRNPQSKVEKSKEDKTKEEGDTGSTTTPEPSGKKSAGVLPQPSGNRGESDSAAVENKPAVQTERDLPGDESGDEPVNGTPDLTQELVGGDELSKTLVAELQRLPGWGKSHAKADLEWLAEVNTEYPQKLSVSIIRSCRDYHSGKQNHTVGQWKARLRNWLRIEFTQQKKGAREFPRKEVKGVRIES